MESTRPRRTKSKPLPPLPEHLLWPEEESDEDPSYDPKDDDSNYESGIDSSEEDWTTTDGEYDTESESE